MTPLARRFVLSLIPLLPMLLGAHPLPAVAEARWTPIGPDGGTISVLAVAPGARRTVYAGTRLGLLFRSTDAGATWSPAGPGLPLWSLTSLLVDPGDPLALYAGFATMPGFQGSYRSVDGGRTWAVLGSGLPATSVWSLAMDPLDPSVLLAGTSAGVFRSEDGGASWSPTGLGEVQFQEVKAVIFDPSTPGRAWAARLGSGIFASSDGGRTWTSRNAGIPSTGSVIALAIDPSTGALYAGLSLIFPGQPLYRSTDAGASWSPVAVEGMVVNALAVSPGPAPAVYAATGSGVFRSADGGVTWTASQGRLGGLVLSLAVPPFPDSIVYAGAFSEGVFKSADRGVSWRQASRGINAAEVRALAVAPSAPSILYLALYTGVASRTIVRSTDGGATWQEAGGGLTQGLDPYLLEVDPRDPRIVWAASYEGRIWKTTNGGESWEFLPEGEDMTCMNTRALAVDPVDPDKVYAAGLRETACTRTHNEGCTGFRTTNGGRAGPA